MKRMKESMPISNSAFASLLASFCITIRDNHQYLNHHHQRHHYFDRNCKMFSLRSGDMAFRAGEHAKAVREYTRAIREFALTDTDNYINKADNLSYAYLERTKCLLILQMAPSALVSCNQLLLHDPLHHAGLFLQGPPCSISSGGDATSPTTNVASFACRSRVPCDGSRRGVRL